jgi:hypothetical protein
MKLTPTAWRHGLLPIPRPMTPEEIYQDVLEAISMDTGISVEGLRAGRTELTEEELTAWHQRMKNTSRWTTVSLEDLSRWKNKSAAVGGAFTGSISGDIRTVTAVQRSPEFLNRKARRRRRALERP